MHATQPDLNRTPNAGLARGSKAPAPAPGVSGALTDRVYRAFLESQCQQGKELADQSDVLTLTPAPGSLPQRFLADFYCYGAARARSGGIVVARRHHLVGLFFPDDYLRRVEVPQVLTWLEPLNVVSPHIAPPFICVGRIRPGTPLVDLLYQIYEIIVFFRVKPREDDALNRAACSWARSHLAEFPLDRAPLKRRAAPVTDATDKEQAG